MPTRVSLTGFVASCAVGAGLLLAPWFVLPLLGLVFVPFGAYAALVAALMYADSPVRVSVTIQVPVAAGIAVIGLLFAHAVFGTPLLLPVVVVLLVVVVAVLLP